MNSAEAAQLLSTLHGAYPGTYFDGSVAETFSNSFITNDFEVAKAAVTDWVARVDRFPTIAELNALIRRLRGRETEDDDRRELPAGNGPCTVDQAREAFSKSYRRARAELGDDNDTIEEKLNVLMRRFPGSILGPFLADVNS